mgnify:CR=1 FL=1
MSTPSARLRIGGGPIEVLNANTTAASEALEVMVPNASLHTSVLALFRRLLAQAILDAYEAGRRAGMKQAEATEVTGR